MPFGFEQGDPLIVCIGGIHREMVRDAFQMRAYYGLWLENVTGRRFGRVIFFRPTHGMSDREEERYKLWEEEICTSRLYPPNRDNIFHV